LDGIRVAELAFVVLSVFTVVPLLLLPESTLAGLFCDGPALLRTSGFLGDGTLLGVSAFGAVSRLWAGWDCWAFEDDSFFWTSFFSVWFPRRSLLFSFFAEAGNEISSKTVMHARITSSNKFF
jgi:hypothetical protein